jgi:hypothetical protein
MPRTLVVEIDGLLLIEKILEHLDEQRGEVAVLCADSPAAQQPQWTTDALRAMTLDPELRLVVEDDRISPTPMAPCIAVRREYLRYAMQGLPPITLRELADRLKRHAVSEGHRFKKLPLVEVPPDLL